MNGKPSERSVRLARQRERLRHILKRVPFTLVLFTGIMIFGVVTELIGESLWPYLASRFSWDLVTIQQGKIYFAWLGLFFAEAPDSFYAVLLALLVVVGALEYRRGTATAVLGFLVVGPIASIITLMLLWPLSAAGVSYVRVALYTPDMGASTACLACLGILLIGEKGLWRNILLPAFLVVLAGFIFVNTPYNIDHFDGYVVGLVTGAGMGWFSHTRLAKKMRQSYNSMRHRAPPH
jgi:membrane associated rhomboid family serine protease